MRIQKQCPVGSENLKGSDFTFVGRTPSCELISRATTLLIKHRPGDESLSSIPKALLQRTKVFGEQRLSQPLHYQLLTN